MYNHYGTTIPGKQHEKIIKIYFIERRFDDEYRTRDPYNYKIHTAQEIVLVKTAEFTSTIASARATSTRKPKSGSDNDGPKYSGGRIAAIVVPTLILFFAIVIFCVWKASCYRAQRKSARTYVSAEAAAREMQNASQALLDSRRRAEGPGRAVGDGPGQNPTLDPAAQRGTGDAELPTYARDGDAPPKYTP